MAPQRALVSSLLRSAGRSAPARASLRSASTPLTCCSRAHLSTTTTQCTWRAAAVAGRAYPRATGASSTGKLYYSTEKSGGEESLNSRKWEFPDITRQIEVNQELEKTGKDVTSAGEHKVIFVGTQISPLPP